MKPILTTVKKLVLCTHYMVKMELIHFFSFPTSIAVLSLDLAFVILKGKFNLLKHFNLTGFL